MIFVDKRLNFMSIIPCLNAFSGNFAKVVDSSTQFGVPGEGGEGRRGEAHHDVGERHVAHKQVHARVQARTPANITIIHTGNIHFVHCSCLIIILRHVYDYKPSNHNQQLSAG